MDGLYRNVVLYIPLCYAVCGNPLDGIGNIENKLTKEKQHACLCDLSIV